MNQNTQPMDDMAASPSPLRPLLDAVDEMSLQVCALHAVEQLAAMARNDLHALDADSLSSLLGSIQQGMRRSLHGMESAIADVAAKRNASCAIAAKE